MLQKGAVRASDRAELELAFRTADRIIVEGDAALREQAQYWAKHGLPDVPVEVDGAAIPEGTIELELLPENNSNSKSISYAWAGLLFGILVFIVGIASTLYWNQSVGVRGTSEAAEAEQESVMSIVTLLVWPAVAFIALCMMFLLARQALTIGANVHFEWRVTEKVSGKLVISKVRTTRKG